MTCRKAAMKIWVSYTFFGARIHNIWKGTNDVQNSARFWTTFDFSSKYHDVDNHKTFEFVNRNGLQAQALFIMCLD